MFYKNAMIYTLTALPSITHQDLEPATFEPCPPHTWAVHGWVSPFPGSDQLVHQADNALHFCLQVEERLLPGPFLKRRLREEVARIEKEQERKVLRSEMNQLKEALEIRLLPQAFTAQRQIRGHIDYTTGTLWLDTAGPKWADTTINALRAALGGLQVVPVSPGAMTAPALVLRRLTIEPVGNFKAQGEARLEYPGEPGSIAIKDEPLDSEEVQAHLHGGMFPCEVRAALEQNGERIASATITSNLHLKRIKISDVLIFQNSGELEDSAKDDADMHLNVSAMRDLYRELVEQFHIGEGHDTAADAA